MQFVNNAEMEKLILSGEYETIIVIGSKLIIKTLNEDGIHVLKYTNVS